MNDLDLSLSALRRRYQSAELRPCEVVTTLHGRIGQGAPNWISVAPLEDLLEACSNLERRRARGEMLPLYGVPFGVKDNIDVAGMPTTAACPAFSYVAERSARCVELLEQAGAICLGKTNLDQLATGLSGTRSPYGACSSIGNSLYISGGSSSGSAVTVAAGEVSFALGTDTGGSGRIPAGFNGVVGIKPTRGRVSTRGLVPNCPTLDCVSIFSRTIDEGMTILRVVDGFDEQDPFSRRPDDSNPEMISRPFSFGILPARDREWFGMPECAVLYESACDRLAELGGRPVEVDFTAFREAGRLLFDGPWIAERRAALASFVDNNRDALYPTTRVVLSMADNYDATSAFAAAHRLAKLRRTVDQQFSTIAMLVVPTAARPFTIEEMNADPIRLNNQLGHYSYFANLLDLCAIAVPNGTLRCGVPMGVTLLAPAWAEHRLARIASWFEEQQHSIAMADA